MGFFIALLVLAEIVLVFHDNFSPKVAYRSFVWFLFAVGNTLNIGILKDQHQGTMFLLIALSAITAFALDHIGLFFIGLYQQMKLNKARKDQEDEERFEQIRQIFAEKM